MGGERHGSKSGRYVGGFLQLFDWNAKSRKKLFSSNSDSPERSKQGKRSEGNFPMTRIRLVDEEEYGSDYSCASSFTDEDVYGTRAPGVVARLMGLDSLPTSNPLEPYSTAFFDTLSLREAPTLRRRNVDYYNDHHIMSSRSLIDKAESPPRQPLDLRPRNKMPIRPIEKFQTEILPPKSAKTIPITHNKLLSPIKSPIFVPSQDAAHIMEAAARIIEPGPQANPRSRLSSSSGSSSSVPFKVREMREKIEGVHKPSKTSEPSQRLNESNAAKCLRGQPMNKSWNGSVDGSFSSSGVKNKGKSISLAIQAKVNVQKREGLAQCSRNLGGGTEEQDDTKSFHSFNSQSSGPRVTNRKLSTQSSSSVLRQNNQKQNCSSKSSLMTSSGKKAISDETSSHGRQKSLVRDAGHSRSESRKSSLQARNCENKEVSYSRVRNVPRKRRSIENMQGSNNEKPSHSKVEDRKLNWIEESRRKGMDVVSFTFSAPITRSLSGSELSKQLAEKKGNLFGDDRSKKLLSSGVSSRLSSPGLNGMVGGDALSILLEQKLKELTSNFDTSHHNFIEAGPPIESVQQAEIEPEQLRKYNFQGGEAMENKYSSSNDETKQWNDNRLPSPVSILEPSVLTESFYSESIASGCTEESKQCTSSVQAQEVHGSKDQTTGNEIDTLDSASSSHTRTVKDPMKSTTAWELGYIKDILCNVELMFKDYATGRTREIVNPHLFDQMEKRRGFLGTGEDESKLERKVLFDCVTECLDSKCQRFVGGGFETWAKAIATVKRKEILAEEVYKEIQGWKSLGNSMVDELVDRDMSSKNGKWLDFEADEFMLGVEIERLLLDSLVEEIVADIFPCNNLSLR